MQVPPFAHGALMHSSMSVKEDEQIHVLYNQNIRWKFDLSL